MSWSVYSLHLKMVVKLKTKNNKYAGNVKCIDHTMIEYVGNGADV